MLEFPTWPQATQYPPLQDRGDAQPAEQLPAPIPSPRHSPACEPCSSSSLLRGFWPDGLWSRSEQFSQVGLCCNRNRGWLSQLFCLLLETRIPSFILKEQQCWLKPEDCRKVEAFLWSTTGRTLTLYCQDNTLWESVLQKLTSSDSPAELLQDRCPGKHQHVTLHPLSELLCWQELSVMTIASPPAHTGLHYRKHGPTESQFLCAAIGFGLIPSSHYLTISFQEFPLTSPVSIYFYVGILF